MASCHCGSFVPLELTRDEITRCIKSTKKLLPQLQVLGQDQKAWHELRECPSCGGYWQVSRAWNWGNKPYAFRVPNIELDEWKQEAFVAPAELMIYVALMEDFLTKSEWASSTMKCRKPDCSRQAMHGLVVCLQHHILSLQRVAMLPEPPKGRWFEPYGPEVLDLGLSDA